MCTVGKSKNCIMWFYRLIKFALNSTFFRVTFFPWFHLYFYTSSVLMEISPPILVKNILWLPHINLNEVISKNLILNIIIVIFNTSSGAKKVMPSLHYFVLLFFMCVCVWRAKIMLISLVWAQCLALSIATLQ